MKESIRAFIAIPLPGDVKAQARAIQAQFRDKGLRLRWVKPHGMHLTLKFLGDIDPRQAPALEAALAAAAKIDTDQRPFLASPGHSTQNTLSALLYQPG